MTLRKYLIFDGGVVGRILRCRLAFLLAMLFVTAMMSGCGGGGDGFDDHTHSFVAQSLSDPAADGDIAFSAPDTYTISRAQAAGNVLAGIDPASGDEFRAFLDFPLRGPQGVPSSAIIVSATLELFINSTTVTPPDSVIPLMIDLVAFQPPVIIVSDFDRTVQPPLLTMPLDIFTSDPGSFVVVDVTALVDEAQIRGLPDLQLRLLLDYIASTGLVEIDDSDAAAAPLLTVEYIL